MRTRLAVLVSLAVIAIAVSGCTVKGCGGTAVPDVKGMTPVQAEAALKAAGFTPGKVTYDAAAQGAAGAVVLQDPAAGTSADAGAVVNLTVAGAEPVKVPTVTGMSKDAATGALTAVGLTLGSATDSTSDSVASGIVISQSPEAGNEAAAGASVAIVVSTGPVKVTPPTPPTPPVATQVKVPAVKTLKLAVAQAKITAAGLKWKQVLGPGDGMSDVGFVYKSSPVAGTLVDKGSTVTLYTWEGP